MSHQDPPHAKIRAEQAISVLRHAMDEARRCHQGFIISCLAEADEATMRKLAEDSKAIFSLFNSISDARAARWSL